MQQCRLKNDTSLFSDLTNAGLEDRFIPNLAAAAGKGVVTGPGVIPVLDSLDEEYGFNRSAADDNTDGGPGISFDWPVINFKGFTFHDGTLFNRAGLCKLLVICRSDKVCPSGSQPCGSAQSIFQFSFSAH
jgi:hypothetical protein